MTQAKKTKKTTNKKTLSGDHRKKAHKAISSPIQSFHIIANEPPFTTIKLTRQTLYWTIFVVTVILSQLWILHLQLELDTLLDQQQTAMQEITR